MSSTHTTDTIVLIATFSYNCAQKIILESSRMRKLHADIIIIGGGIAGLWSLNILQQAGYKVILLENQAIGSGQTIKSQGIIHGGLKYALHGILTNEANALANMPKLWSKCLQGLGEIDLSSVSVHSEYQYIWSNGNLSSKVSNFFASKALSNNSQALAAHTRPDIFQHQAFKGTVYQLNEIVLNIPSLLAALVSPYWQHCIQPDNHEYQFKLNAQGAIDNLVINIGSEPLALCAQHYLFAAGSGNQQLIAQVHKTNNIHMQHRPLHMVVLKNKCLPKIYGHCITTNTIPRITITTHTAKDNETIWYLGGQIAETGLEKDQNTQIAYAQQELTNLFPWVDLKNATWSSFFINRAEAKQKFAKKPEGIDINTYQNFSIGWPTKLALAPVFARKILEQLKINNIVPLNNYLSLANNLIRPKIAPTIWDQLLCS